VNIKEKLHLLIDQTNDPTLLENILQVLDVHAETSPRDILDDLSASDLQSLNESIAQYRRGEVRSHEEILDLLREWRAK
jgi:hypothetical protein